MSRIRRLVAALLAIGLPLVLLPGPVDAAGPGAVDTRNLGSAPVERVIVRWTTGAGAVAAAARTERLAANVPGVRKAADIAADAAAYWLPAPRGREEALEDLRALARVRGVAEVAPDLFIAADLTPNDTYYASNQQALFGTWGIDAPAAWDTTTGSAAVPVAVIDTGITAHPEFAGRVLPGYDFISALNVANDGDGRDPDPSDPGDWCGGKPSSWHGTHVAGIVGAAGNNNAGVAGVAWDSPILPVRVLGTCGGYTSDIAAAIRWAAGGSVSGVPANAHPARILNLSLSGSGSCDTTTQAAINAAISLGAIIIVAAGNNGAPATSYTPANCDGVISVAAVDANGKRASFSNYGSSVTIAAPGAGIASTLNTGATVPGDPNYALYSGTSMAAPHVAGVAALALSVNPSLTASQLRSLLTSTVKAVAADAADLGCPTVGCGAGIVDAGAAVAAAVVSAVPFTDIAGSMFQPDIVWLWVEGITTGCTPTLYCPTSPVTRAQMASFLARALALPATTTDYFTDDGASVHEPDINRLAAAGITTGCGGGRFCPDATIRRDDMAAFLARALALPATPTDFFTDDETSIHEASINRVAAAGITTGCGPSLYCPAASVSRGEMAAFLHRALDP